jgi:asparagine N-glycosylation enzyme membrane subunit Stt3
MTLMLEFDGNSVPHSRLWFVGRYNYNVTKGQNRFR